MWMRRISLVEWGYKTVCLNDTDCVNFEKTRLQMQEVFESILPDQSEFEK
jgi:hypothetical protein